MKNNSNKIKKLYLYTNYKVKRNMNDVNEKNVKNLINNNDLNPMIIRKNILGNNNLIFSYNKNNINQDMF